MVINILLYQIKDKKEKKKEIREM